MRLSNLSNIKINKKLVIGGLAIIISLGAIFLSIFYFTSSHKNKKDFSGDYQAAWLKLIGGRNTEAITDYEKSIAEREKDGQAVPPRMKLQLGVAKNSANDFSQGIALLKEEAKTATNSSRIIKSVAILQLAELTLILPKDIIYDQIYKGSDFEEKYVSGDSLATAENMLRYGILLTPNAPSLYRLSDMDAEKLVEKGSVSVSDETEINRIALELVRELNISKKHFENVKPDGWDMDRLLICYLYEAKVGDKLNKILGKRPELKTAFETSGVVSSNEAIEELFRKALDLSSDPMIALNPERFDYFTRLYYAVFLNNAYGTARIDDINNLLAPIYQSENKTDAGLFVYLQNLAHYPNDRYFKIELLSLAKVVPQFKDMLQKAGWAVE
jgi:hypothetical protein